MPVSFVQLLSERLKFVESELKSHRQQLRTLTLERDNLLEDMCHVKAAKRQSDEVHQLPAHSLSP